MKIMIMTDMEGCAGIQNFKDWVNGDSRYYDAGKRLLTLEVNAAVAGLFAGGATEVRVVDAHGCGGINVELLDERSTLLGWPPPWPPWPWTLDKSFQGLCFVGQHAKAGTDYSHMTHTGTFGYIDFTVNGISIGEYGQFALCARELGVPVILACGEEALCREAEALTPGVVTVGVKRGLQPDGLDNLDADQYSNAKLAAIHLMPGRARKLIRAGALKAMRQLKKKPTAFRFPKLTPPYVRVARLRRQGDKPPYESRAEHPDSVIDLLNSDF